MKKLLSISITVILVLMLIPIGTFTSFAEVYNGSCGENLIWEVDTSTGVLKIKGTGAMYDYDDSNEHQPPWSGFYYTINEIKLSDGLTYIGDYAFWRCSNVNEIVMPNTVTSMGKYVFAYAEDIETVILSENLTTISERAFYECSSPSEISIPEKVTCVEKYAFASMNSLTKIHIPQNVTEIAEGAFMACRNLHDIEIENGIRFISRTAFDGTGYYYSPSNWDGDVLYISNYLVKAKTTVGGHYIVKDNTVGIIEDSFANCKDLVEITLPESLLFIDDDAFYNCKIKIINNYSTLYIDKRRNSSNDIGWYAEVVNWYGKPTGKCGEDLTYIFDPEIDKLTISGTGEMYDYTSFEYGKRIKEIELLNGVTSISDFTFSNFDNLVKITLPNSLTEIGIYAIYGCENLTEIIIPEKVSHIKTAAFSYCNNLEKITVSENNESYYSKDNCIIETKSKTLVLVGKNRVIPKDENIKTIGEFAFAGRVEIEEIVIPDSVTSIEANAFRGCTNLKEITIGSSIQSIGNYVFNECGEDLLLKVNENSYAHNYALQNNFNIYLTYVSAPKEPTLVFKNNTKVILTANSNYQYSLDGVNWQDSNIFNNLNRSTTYQFYQRIKETDSACASERSISLSVTTDSYTTGDLDGNDTITDSDAVHLLFYTFFPDDYPLNQDCDFDGDGLVNDSDAVHLLFYTFFPEDYPIE